MKTPPLAILAGLPEILPIHVEEGPVREECPRAELEAALAQSARLSAEGARVAVGLLERLFDAGSLLDRRVLAKGSWAFVSYPAYLLGRSLAEALANEGARFVSGDYWEQGSHRPAAVREQQRELLHFLESGRQLQSAGVAPPIRFVWVAWGLVRLGGKFLLRHREDRSRPEVKNYVLPGGRLSLADLPGHDEPRVVFRRLGEDAGYMAAALRSALQRELAEELSLIHSTDYTATEWRVLAPYRAVEGAGNNHALTAYRIALSTIKLTPEGEVKLYDHIAQNREQFCWFGAGDLARQQLVDGRRAFIDAMIADWDGRTEEILGEVPDSAGMTYRHAAETDALDVPVATGQPFKRGKTGKERALQIPLQDDELGIIRALAWHAKLPGGVDATLGVTLLPNGWVKLGAGALAERTRLLIAKLETAGLPILECQQDDFFRLNVDPSILFFDESAFSYRIRPSDERGRDCQFELTLAGHDSPLGKLLAQHEAWPVTTNIQRALFAIEAGKDPEMESTVKSGDLEKSLRDSVDLPARKIGLRKTVRTPKKRYELAIQRASEPTSDLMR